LKSSIQHGSMGGGHGSTGSATVKNCSRRRTCRDFWWRVLAEESAPEGARFGCLRASDRVWKVECGLAAERVRNGWVVAQIPPTRPGACSKKEIQQEGGKAGSERELRFFRSQFLARRNAGKSNCLSLQGEFWICSRARCLRIVEKKFLSSEERLLHNHQTGVKKKRFRQQPVEFKQRGNHSLLKIPPKSDGVSGLFFVRESRRPATPPVLSLSGQISSSRCKILSPGARRVCSPVL
jgi:hypothetical protein